MIANIIRNAKKTVTGGDPYYSAVSLLLPMDGTNGSTTFTDSSLNGLTVTPVGNTQVSTTQSKYGGASGFFDGTGDYLSISPNTAIDLSSSDFTIEFWIRPAPKTNAVDAAFGYSNYACMFYHNGTNWTLEMSSTGFSNQLVISFAVTLNTWQHIAIVRSGTSVVVYKDGVSSASGTFTGTVATSGRTLRIGDNGNSQNINGYLDDFRISLFARYVSNFTPPTAALPTTASSTPADPYYGYTSLLLHMDGSSGSTNFVDSGPNALTVTAAANAQISTTQFKYGTASGYFDGTGDSLTIPANTALALGAGDYTIEGWFYSLTSGTSLRGMIDFRTAATGTNGLMLRENDGGFLVYLNSAILLSTTTGRIANQWQHVALVRKGTTVTLYVDGVSRATATSSTTLTDNVLRISGFIDTQSNLYTYNGYIDDLRITKYARYQSSFTPPAQAHLEYANGNDRHFSNVSLLLHMDGANGSTTFTDNSANALAVTAVGNAQVSTTQSKYGGASAYFDGAGDYLDIPYGNSLNITTDYTIEFWMRADSVTGYAPIFTITSATTSFFGGIYVVRNGSAITFETRPADGSGSSVIAITGGSISTNTWYHVAASVSGNSARLFINGVQIGSTTTFTTRTFTPTGARIGRFANNFISGLVDFAGYIDDLRVTKYARYTSAFTPPTSAFPNS